MAVYKRGDIWWYGFILDGKRIQGSSKSTSKTVAKEAERECRRQLVHVHNGSIDPQKQRKQRIRTVSDVAAVYLKDYALRHKSITFADYNVKHLIEHLGNEMVSQIDDRVVQNYQSARLNEKAAPKTINGEVSMLLLLMGRDGELLRVSLKRAKKLKIGGVKEFSGKAFNVDEKDRMLDQAKQSRSPLIFPALVIALNTGMRDGEIKRTCWSQIDFEKAIFTVGRSKTSAGTGRTIPLNDELRDALLDHAKWYATKFKELKPEWYVFPFGRRGRMDPTRPITTMKTAWSGVRGRAGVTGRWHDTRHTLITELAESGAGSQTIKDIAGHVSQQMLDRYSHISTEAKRAALEDVSKRRHTARGLAAKKKAAASDGVVTTVN
jgi:integrase